MNTEHENTKKSPKIMNLKIKAFLILFVLQAIASSCDPMTFQVTFHGMILEVVNKETHELLDLLTPIDKSNFELKIDLLKQERQIGSNAILNTVTKFGFNSCYANGIGDEYFYIDPPVSIEILATNTVNNEVTTVTNSFEESPYTPLLEQFEYKSYYNDSYYNDLLYLYLIEFDTIPNSAIFTVKITLKSGVVLEKETNTITFN